MMNMDASNASDNILGDLKFKQDILLANTQQGISSIIDAYRTAVQSQVKISLEELDKLDKRERELEEEKETANKKRLKDIEKEIEKVNELREAEMQRVKDAEDALEKQIALRKAAVAEEERISKIQKTREDMKKEGKSAKSIMGTGKNIMSGGVKSSQIDLRGYTETIASYQKQIDALKEAVAKEKDESKKEQLKKDIENNEKEKQKAEREKATLEAINALNEAFAAKVDESVKILEANELKANTRLMGSMKQFSNANENIGKQLLGSLGILSNNTAILDVIRKNLAASPFVKSTDVIKDISNGISQGIVTNVEMRGFLNSIKDGIVSTFEAFSEDINKLIRIQQEDSTQARMGMEASLMKLYNRMFETSEYLKSGFDSVTKAIYDASSIVSASQAEEMEFVMQKWLGSLYSVGMSQQTVTNIANAINQLASGDVSQLGTGTQNLIAMALNKVGGLSYDKVLTQGINPTDLNTLMFAVVSYLQEIAESSQNNNVVQKELGNVFGVTISDIKAATNLTAQDISELKSYAQSYADAEKELNNQMSTMWTRMSKSVLLSNVYENFMFTSGMTVAENPVTYFMQKVLGALPNMETPMPQAMGSGLSSGLPLKDILQTALTGFGLIGGVINSVQSLAAGGGLNLDMWNINKDVTRGSMGLQLSSGFTQTTSGSRYAASGSDEDLKASAMGMGKEQSEQAGETVGTGDVDTEYTSSNIYKLLTGMDENTIAPIDVVISSVKLDNAQVQGLIEEVAARVLEKFTGVETTSSVKVEITNLEDLGSSGMYPGVGIGF